MKKFLCYLLLCIAFLSRIPQSTYAQCSGTPLAGTVSATVTNSCSFPFTSTLSVAGYTTGTGILYQWQSSPDSISWTNIVGATTVSYLATVTIPIMYYRFADSCTNSGIITYSTGKQLGNGRRYATIPFAESFETNWLSNCNTWDAPNIYWQVTPYNGNNSWRRNDQGSLGGWINPTFYNYSPTFTTGSYSARYHNSYTNTPGNLDLYINMSTAGTKQIQFDYIGTDNSNKIAVYISTDGGANFSPLDSVIAYVPGWTTKTITTNAISDISIIRFIATGDFNVASDIGLDNVSVTILPTCSGTPSTGTINMTGTGSCSFPFNITFSVLGYTTGTGMYYQWQSSTDSITWTNISGATNVIYTATDALPIMYYRFYDSCSTSGLFSVTNGIKTGNGRRYASIPFAESFETNWTNYCATWDEPNIYWQVNNPYSGNNSWRRNDQGSTAGWTNATFYSYSPTATTGSYSARYHNSYANTPGNLDLYINMSTAGTKQIQFDYIGTDNSNKIAVYISTNGGATFSPLDSVTAYVPGWTTKTLTTNAISDISIIRFIATGDFNVGSDIGLDNVSVTILPTCSGTPATGTINMTGTGSCSFPFNITFSVLGYTTGTGMYYQWQSSTDSITWTNISGATNVIYTATAALPIMYYRFYDSCSTSGLFSVTNGIKTGNGRRYATIPFAESFETNWTNYCATWDEPNIYWQVNNPYSGNNSWRRNDQGSTAGWTNATLYSYSPTATTGSYSARYHNSYANTPGNLDLYINMSLPLNKAISFDYFGIDGSNKLALYLSTNGGATFTPVDSIYTSAPGWHTKLDTVYTTSDICILRFIATGDFNVASDIGLDNIQVVDVAPCAGSPVAGTTTTVPSGGGSTTNFSLGLTGETILVGINYQWQDSSITTGGLWVNIPGATNMTYNFTGITTDMYVRCSETCIYGGFTTYSTPALLMNVNCTPIPFSWTNLHPVGTYNYTSGTVQTFTVAPSVNTLIFDAIGATGGAGSPSAGTTATGGAGGRVQGFLSVSAGQILNIYVGGAGGNYTSSGSSLSLGGTIAGGTAGNTIGGGGGASDIRIGGTGLANRYIVAGGGGGGGWDYGNVIGGAGGGLIGLGGNYTGSLSTSWAGQGGTQTAGGAGALGGVGGAGSLGIGGNSENSSFGGAGGGGYYGGGGGYLGGGGGGSSYTNSTYVYNVTHTQGYNSTGNGSVKLYTLLDVVADGINAVNILGSVGSINDAGLVAATDPVTGYVNRGIIPAVSFLPGGSYASSITWMTTGTYQEAQVWIDFNNDLIFQTSEIVSGGTTLGYSTTSTPNPTTFNITIPTGAASGLHLMRIRGVMEDPFYGYSHSTYLDPCLSSYASSAPYYLSGNVIDYYINIQSCSGTPTAGSVNATVSSGCTGFTSVLSLSGSSTGTSFTYQWQSSPDGSTYSAISGATNSVYSASVTATTYYNCVITCMSSSLSATTTATTLSIISAPTVSSITGTTTICIGTPSTLSDATSGGTWSSSNTAIATINTSGVVSGVSAGSATISYNVTNSCGTANASFGITVNPLPIAGTITGIASICVGSSTSLADAAGGGTWSSSSTTIATVNTSGVVNGVGSGTATISYSVTGTCGTLVATLIVTVNAMPAAGTITGVPTVCVGSATTLSDTATGGPYIGTPPSIGQSFGGGIVAYLLAPADPGYSSSTPKGLIAAPSDQSTGRSWALYYTWVPSSIAIGSGAANTANMVSILGMPCAAYVCDTLTLNGYTDWYLPSANELQKLCYNKAAIGGFATGTSIGYWSSSQYLYSPYDQAYYVDFSDFSTCGITNIPDYGGMRIRAVRSFSLVPTTTWSSSNTAIATVNGAGVVTGISTGIDTITYTVSNGSCTSSTTKVITVNSATAIATITGTAVVCAGSSTSLADATSGGTWSSVSTGIATVNTSGVVTGVSSGTVTISYTVTGGCGTNSITTTITVNPLPIAGTILGTLTLCQATITSLSESSSGGSWSCGNSSIATINSSGVVTGVANGIDSIFYSVTNSCGTATANAVVTVNPLPDAGVISGSLTICPTSTTSLSETVSGGVWSSASTGVATVNTSGVVTGVSTGTSVISYTASNSCGSVSSTTIVTVNLLPNAGSITGLSAVCESATTSLADGISGGVWSSASTVIATVNTSGIVTGVSIGSTNITYTVTNSCGTANTTYSITVNPLPNAGTITGTTTVCPGSTTTLTDAVIGGTWSTGNTLIATIGTSGITTGVSSGTVTISYTYTNSCGSTNTITIVTVNPLPNAGIITGTTSVCVSSLTLLSDIVGAGVWISGNTSVATVSSSGLITGVSSGTSTISYAVTNSCGIAYATSIVTVNPLPYSGNITGTTNVCAGSITSLTDLATGGTWSSSNTSIATVGSTGITTGVSAGTATITYTYTNVCGTDYTTTAFTVNPLPIAGTITGTTSACVSSLALLSDVAGGGVWSSNNTSIAAVNTSGLVSGIAAGIATISYAVTNSCGTAVASSIVTINPLPNAGAITGTPTLCAGSITSLTDIAIGGTWSSSATGIATVDGLGNVTGISAGTSTISYTYTNVCGTANTSILISVNPLPYAGTITGTTAVCVSSLALLSDVATGGTWSSSNSSIATVGTFGIVTGITAGNATISYLVSNSCGTAIASAIVTINALPNAGIISGTSVVCAGSALTLSDGTAGGTWSSGSTDIATINSSGIVSGVSSGTATITYTVSNLCGTDFTTSIVTINPLPFAGTITGTTSICVGSFSLLSAAPGGIWSSSAPGITSISTSGLVDGLSVGISTISYFVSNSCGTAVASTQVTVNTTPVAGSITGVSAVCQTSTITLTDGVSGGVWSSTSSTVASVDATGIVTGNSAGVATISYTISTGCGTTVATKTITVNALPDAGSITGITSICIAGTTSLSNIITGGVWSSSSTSVATIDGSGNVLGISAGVGVISYTVSGSCGTASSITIITVNTTPAAIGGSSVVCTSNTTTLTDVTTSGTIVPVWSSSNTTVATIGSNSGLLSGILAGVVIISYSNGCGMVTKIITVNASPQPIVGITSMCIGNISTLTDPILGGFWSSSSPSIASIGFTNGIIDGLAAGTVTISYNTGCSTPSMITITINPLPSIITGSSQVCAGSTISLSDTASGGTWSSSNTLASVDGFGNVTGNANGLATITYTLPTGCFKSRVITVNPLPNAGAITGLDSVCSGASITLTDTFAGGTGTWISLNTTVATVSGHVITGHAVDSVTINYSVTNGCGIGTATTTIWVNPLPDAGTITGTGNVCIGNNLTLTDLAIGGTWTRTNTKASVLSGVVTGITIGMDTIIYSNSNSCGTATTRTTVTINPLPTGGTITGTDNVCVTSNINLFDTTAIGTGTWGSNNTTANISLSGVVTGVHAGIDTIVFNVTNFCGSASSTKVITINPLPNAGLVLGLDTLCNGLSTMYSDTASSGTWSVTNPHATISISGLLTGISAGTDSVIYSVTNSCGSAYFIKPIYIRPLAVAGTIIGSDSLCAGTSITLSSSSSGGVWSTSNTNANVVGGLVTGVAAGIDTIIYTAMNVCDTSVATKYITVRPQPNSGTISGADSVCNGATISLSETVSGGLWFISNSHASVTGGIVTGVSVGMDTVIYSVTNNCGTIASLKSVYVKPLPDAGSVIGIDSMCIGTPITLTDVIAGGVWGSSNLYASVSGGVVIGVNAGTDTISYSVTNSCGTAFATKTITVLPTPNAGTIIGTPKVCIGGTVTLTDASLGGTWSSINNTLATVSGGVVSGLAIGIDTIKYNISNSCGSSTATLGILVETHILPTLTGASKVCIDEKTDTLIVSPLGGTWSASNTNGSVVGGIVTGVAPGTVTITYSVTNSCGTVDTSIVLSIYTKAQCDSMNYVNVVNRTDEGITVYPNPASDMFTIEYFGAGTDIEVAIMDMYGKIIISKEHVGVKAGKLMFNTIGLSSGTYTIKVIADNRVYWQKIVIMNER